MNNQSITTTSGMHDPILEAYVQKRDGELKTLSRKQGTQRGQKNRPALQGDKLLPYVGEIIAGYEELAIYVRQYLQPESHLSKAQLDAGHFQDKDKILVAKIKEMKSHKDLAQKALGNFTPGTMPLRIIIVLLITFIISVGETIWTTKSFQVTGENILFSLLLSFSVSTAIFAASHIIPLIYKKQTTSLRRRIVFFVSLFIMLGMFFTLAMFRTQYLAAHDIHISPFSFVIINLFFFGVSVFLSFFVFPSWDELKENLGHVRQYYAVKKNQREIDALEAKQADNKSTIVNSTHDRISQSYYASHLIQRVRKLCAEALHVFISSNMDHREDELTPQCFQEPLPEPAIADFVFDLIPNKQTA